MLSLRNSLPIQERQEQYSKYETIVLKQSPVFEFNPTPIHSLWIMLHQISDYRRAQGKRHSLPVLILLTILAMSCGYSSYEAIKDYAGNYQDQIRREIPFLAGHTPAASTFHRVFSDLDVEALETVFGKWIKSIVSLEKHEGIAIDGKAVKNTDLYLVSVFAQKAKAVLFQKSTTGKGKELIIAPEVLKQIDLRGKMVTADALYVQKNLCQQITEEGGGYVMTVKENQQGLYESIKLFFTEPPFGVDIEEETTIDKQKGRVEKRSYEVSSDLTAYEDWPGLTHVWKCIREVTKKGKETKQIAYGIARFLSVEDAAKQTAQYVRGHWLIENSLHRQRDIEFNEDRSAIRTKNGPQVMSVLANLVTSVFHRGKVKSFPSAFRRFAAQPQELFAFLGLYRYAV